MSTNLLQYSIVLFLVSTFTGYLWGLCYVVQSFETFLFSILLGFLTGLIASLYFSKSHRLFFQASAFLATLWGFVVAKFIIYSFLHVGGYVVDIETNKALMCFKILIFFQDFKGFMDQLGSQLNGFDKLWLALAIIFSLIYGSRVRSHKRKFYLAKKQFSDWVDQRKNKGKQTS
ncbi:MAG: hypothetical protein ACJAY8_001009 [Sphingobacteriales bacterium]